MGHISIFIKKGWKKMLKVIEEFAKNRDYISLYTNCEDGSKFCYGRIVDFDDINLVFLMISPDGNYDGLLLKQISDIYRINKNDKYNERMQQLCMISDIENYLLNYEESDNVLRSVLLLSKNNNKIVSLELNDSGFDDIVGIVSNVTDSVCEITQIDFYGNLDGKAFVSLSNISQISFDSKTEQILQQLREQNQTGEQ